MVLSDGAMPLKASSYNNLKKEYNQMKIPRYGLLPIAVVCFLTLTIQLIKATPYASCITYTNETIYFHLNESGGNVTVTYEDGSTNSSFNGISTGTNLPSGGYSFSLAGHTSYSISVFKVGTGLTTLAPNTIQNTNINTINGSGYATPSFFVLGDPRGIAVNQNPNSPYFGHVYIGRSLPSSPSTYFYQFDSDGNFVSSNSAGVTWTSSSSYSPYQFSIAADDSLIVGDGSAANAGIWKVTPDLKTNQLLLGSIGDLGTNSSGQTMHGEVISPPLFVGFTNGGSGTLYWIDADYPANDPNALLIETNVLTNSLSSTANLLTNESVPMVGQEIGLNYDYLGNVYPGLTQGPNGYIYASEQRANYATPDMWVLDTNGTALWNSLETAGGPDYFVTQVEGNGLQGLVASAVSPDGKWLVGMAIDNHFTICQLTNGIPNVATIYTVNPTTLVQNGRGICFDAADNFYMISSGEYCAQEWTLGLTTTAVTTGTANGVTGFNVLSPSESVSVTSSNSVISQPNNYNNPTSTSFVFTRTGDTNAALTVNYSLSGTANGATSSGITYPATYTASSASSVTFEPGETTAVVTVTATSDSIPRPTTVLTLTIATAPDYTPVFPSTASINILNTAPQELLTAIGASSMYNAFSNDYCSLKITRWGDTNLPSYQVNSFSPVGSGTAVEGTDFTPPSVPTINPGDLTVYTYINPLIDGQPPVHTNNLPYSGNKTFQISLETSTGNYTVVGNTNTFTILDSANPPATVLYYDPLTNSAPTNWNITASDVNYPINSPYYSAVFGYDLYDDYNDPDQPGDPIPFPPNGATNALRVTTWDNTYSGAVNLYPTNVTFGGNYAVRFSMNVNEPNSFATSGSFEGPLFGINCSGMATNFWYWYTPSGPAVSASAQANWNFDGVWVWISDSGYYGYYDYDLFTGVTNGTPSGGPVTGAYESSFANNFKTNVFTCTAGPGVPCNGSPDNLARLSAWADVELKQFNNVITLSIDKTTILMYTNTTSFTNGTIMLGYANPVFGPDSGDGAAYYSDLKVVKLGPPAVTGTAYDAASGTFNFAFTITDDTAALTVVGATKVTGPYTAVSGATITSLGGGAYEATVPVSGTIHFYRIQQKF